MLLCVFIVSMALYFLERNSVKCNRKTG